MFPCLIAFWTYVHVMMDHKNLFHDLVSQDLFGEEILTLITTTFLRFMNLLLVLGDQQFLKPPFECCSEKSVAFA